MNAMAMNSIFQKAAVFTRRMKHGAIGAGTALVAALGGVAITLGFTHGHWTGAIVGVYILGAVAFTIGLDLRSLARYQRDFHDCIKSHNLIYDFRTDRWVTSEVYNEARR